MVKPDKGLPKVRRPKVTPLRELRLRLQILAAKMELEEQRAADFEDVSDPLKVELDNLFQTVQTDRRRLQEYHMRVDHR